MGIELLGQVRDGVGRVEVLLAPVAVGEAADGDGADDRGEGALVAALHCAVGGTLGVGHLFEALLPEGTEVEVLLQEQA